MTEFEESWTEFDGRSSPMPVKNAYIRAVRGVLNHWKSNGLLQEGTKALSHPPWDKPPLFCSQMSSWHKLNRKHDNIYESIGIQQDSMHALHQIWWIQIPGHWAIDCESALCWIKAKTLVDNKYGRCAIHAHWRLKCPKTTNLKNVNNVLTVLQKLRYDHWTVRCFPS